MLANSSEDRTRRQPLVILRRIYYEITDKNHCAAKLIEYFKHLRKWKLANHRTDWVYMPLKRIYEDLMGEHSLHVIRAAIALLQKKGFLKRRNNPGNGQDKTYQYQLQVEEIDASLATDTKIGVASECNNESPEFNSESSEFTVEQHTEITTIDTKSLDNIPTKKGVSESQLPKEELKRHRVDIGDEHLQSTVAQYPERINDAVAAWLAWAAANSNIKAPTRSLIKAIVDHWKPEKPAIVNEVNPPSPEIMQKLNELRDRGQIEAIMRQQWGDGMATVVVTSGGIASPWWELITTKAQGGHCPPVVIR